MNYFAIPGIRREPLTADLIKKTVCEYYGVDVMGLNRNRSVVHARQVIMYLLRYEARLTSGRIGKYLGRDHSTAIHGQNVIRDLLRVDQTVVSELEAIVKKLRAERL